MLGRPSEQNAAGWALALDDDGESSLTQIADWGPAEDRTEWFDSRG